MLKHILHLPSIKKTELLQVQHALLFEIFVEYT